MKLSALQQYGVVTANYWAFTLTDGALRMLVVFHFHELGYSTLEIAFLFLFYEFFGVVTNLYGGWIGARYGLRLTLWVGTLLQILAAADHHFRVSKTVVDGQTRSRVSHLRDTQAREQELAELAGGELGEARAYAASLLDQRVA